MLTLCHHFSEPILLAEEGEQSYISGYHVMTYGRTEQLAMGNHLKGPLLSLLCEDNLIHDSPARCIVEKTFAKPNTAGYTQGPWTRYLTKMVTILSTATWMGALPCSILCSPWSFTVSHLASLLDRLGC